MLVDRKFGTALAMLALYAGGCGFVRAEQHFKPREPNGLAQTPPMGWNSWNKYGCDINEAIIRKQADAMVSSGMKAAGYGYRPLAGGSQAVVLLNRATEPRAIRLDWSALNLPAYLSVDVRDLWSSKNGPQATGSLTVQVAPRAAVMLKVTPARTGKH
jgi:hypothetical protein